MAKKTLQQVIQDNLQLGFEPQIIKIAYQNVNGDADRVIDEIFRLQSESSHYPTKPSNHQDQDAQLSKAIEMSINQAKDKKISLQPLNPQQRIRKAGVPVGLKNIGNTCYFNSLLQTYFQNIQFVRSVLSYQTPAKYKQLSDLQLQKAISLDSTFKRKQASCKLVENLKILFTSMILSDRKYADPTDVISSVVDDDGAQLQIGDQKDIGQFNLVFLSRVDQGFRLLRGDQEMKDENQQQKNFVESPSKIGVIGNEGDEKLSLLHRQSIKIQQNSLIDKQFIGNMVNFYTNQKHEIDKVQQQQFSLLFVNVRNKQLYNAIEHITIQHIDDYRNEKGQVVGVQKQSWIKTPPKTLFFQIDRVTFDKQTAQLVKSNDEFQFPNTFYIDPFLHKNKQQALQIQKKVRKLRDEKQKYSEALKKMQKFGQKNINLLDMLTETTKFFQQQRKFPQQLGQLDAPTFFPALKSTIKDQHITLLTNYSEQIKSRVNSYHDKIAEIEKQIEKCYQSLRSTPYHLYSILIHEGSAQMGHYYSYTYDIQSKIWRKYNDINISEQVEAQVFKQAKGVNFTSAYYLVYAQEDVLVNKNSDLPLRNYQISSSQNYQGDYYSKLVPSQLRDKGRTDNQQLHYEIQQFKMGGFANRVVDSYTRNFEICNETFRKNKVEKKKTVPPLLTNFPLYVKYMGYDNAYKTCLIDNSINQYGPKEYNPVFQQILKKKMANFNDFKKPKDFKYDQSHVQSFVDKVLKAQIAQQMFKAFKNQSYKGILAMIKLLMTDSQGEYFNWLAKLFCKVMIVSLVQGTQKDIKQQKLDTVLLKLRYVLILCCKFINKDEQKALISNIFFWIAEIAIPIKDAAIKEQVQKIAELLNDGKMQDQISEDLQKQAYSEQQIEQIRQQIDLANIMWNLSRHQNTFITEMINARQQIKSKMQSANNLYKQMKKTNVPLKSEERDKILKAV